MLYLCRRSSSVGAQLFQEKGKPLEPLSVLTETEEDEDDAETPALLQGEKDKPRQDIKDGDPLATLGDKLAKLR